MATETIFAWLVKSSLGFKGRCEVCGKETKVSDCACGKKICIEGKCFETHTKKCRAWKAYKIRLNKWASEGLRDIAKGIKNWHSEIKKKHDVKELEQFIMDAFDEDSLRHWTLKDFEEELGFSEQEVEQVFLKLGLRKEWEMIIND